AAEQQNSPGVVYLFPKGASWTSTTESQKISASDGAPNDGFGGTAVSGGAIALDNSGTAMIVGASAATLARAQLTFWAETLGHQLHRFRQMRSRLGTKLKVPPVALNL